MLAPEGIIVKEVPEQILPLFTEIVGEAFTVTLLIAVLELTQPFVPVPVTLKEELVVGLTIELPLEYVYVLAPLGVSVKELPEQILPLFTLIVGEAFTLTMLIAVFELIQPFVPVPVTL